MKEFTITDLKDDKYNMFITDDYLKELKQIVDNVSLGTAKDMAVINNIELFNNLLYRKAVASFITYLKETTVFKDNTTYMLSITHQDDKHSLIVRNNVIDKQDDIYSGIQGITYGTSLN